MCRSILLGTSQRFWPWADISGRGSRHDQALLFNPKRRQYSSSSAHPYPIAMSSTLTLKKSIFIAYASRLDPPAQTSISTLIDHLQNSSLFKTKGATHIMYAYKIFNPPNPPILGSHDGGESGSGERLERLLGLGRDNGVDNVAVVVLRWYGGIALGPDRWKCISTVAKEALERGGFRQSKEGRKAKEKKNRKKK